MQFSCMVWKKNLGASAISVHGISEPLVLEALSLCSDLNCSKFIVGSDCKGVVEDINQRSGGICATVIKEIGLALREFTSCSFIHEGIRTNTEAHGLAKHTLGLPKCIIFG
jgi:hypothetical protein